MPRKKAKKSPASHRAKRARKNVTTKRVKFLGVTILVTAPKHRHKKARTARVTLKERRGSRKGR